VIAALEGLPHSLLGTFQMRHRLSFVKIKGCPTFSFNRSYQSIAACGS
jgi:hypothetical protein